MQHKSVAGVSLLKQNAIQFVSSKLFGYAGVSVVALGCDVAIYSANVASNMNHTLAAALGYMSGLLVHFLLSRRLVFNSQARGKGAVLEALGFLISGFAGLAITSSVVFLVSDVLNLGSVIAKLAAIIASFSAVYLMRSKIVFKWRSA
jgi:putative flippase GtrA